MNQADAPKDISLDARLVVREAVRDLGDTIQLHELFVVWSCKTLQNWKALVGRVDTPYYYEVTHNGNNNETYVDVYQKIRNILVND